MAKFWILVFILLISLQEYYAIKSANRARRTFANGHSWFEYYWNAHPSYRWSAFIYAPLEDYEHWILDKTPKWPLVVAFIWLFGGFQIGREQSYLNTVLVPLFSGSGNGS